MSDLTNEVPLGSLISESTAMFAVAGFFITYTAVLSEAELEDNFTSNERFVVHHVRPDEIQLVFNKPEMPEV